MRQTRHILVRQSAVMDIVELVFLLLLNSVISLARPNSEIFSKVRSVRDDSYIIRRNEGDPCPIVVAPANTGGNVNFGPLVNFGTFFRGYSKQTGPYDTSFGGNGNFMNGGALGIGGWNQIVPNKSKDPDCHPTQNNNNPTSFNGQNQQQPIINPFLGG